MCSAITLCGLLGLGLLLAYKPAFYTLRQVTDRSPVGEQAARRLVTKISALRADVIRIGAWESVITDAEINAWLTNDLPRNHPHFLPWGIREPRIEFQSKRVSIAARTGAWALSTVVWLELKVQLREINQLGIVLEQARLGRIPLPRNAILRDLARRINAMGAITDLRQLNGQLHLIVSLPESHDGGANRHTLKSLSIETGELLLAGTTRLISERISR